MSTETVRVCPVEGAHALDSRIRLWLQNPRKILLPYIKEGMHVLDVGCGPGFFTVEIAKLVGPSGKVIAADLQDGMLKIIKDKIRGTELEQRIQLVKTDQDRLNVTEKVDFILTFYMVHEVPDKDGLFEQLKDVLKDNGTFLIVEPMFHVTKKAFELTLQKAQMKGFHVHPGPKLLLSHTALLTKS